MDPLGSWLFALTAVGALIGAAVLAGWLHAAICDWRDEQRDRRSRWLRDAVDNTYRRPPLDADTHVRVLAALERVSVEAHAVDGLCTDGSHTPGRDGYCRHAGCEGRVAQP